MMHATDRTIRNGDIGSPHGRATVLTIAPAIVSYQMRLIFEPTKGLFKKWLLYGIGTLFSMGVLVFISSLVLQLMQKVAEALWAAGIINGITGLTHEGFTNQSMQQGGSRAARSVHTHLPWRDYRGQHLGAAGHHEQMGFEAIGPCLPDQP
jgi:hypothetical protein